MTDVRVMADAAEMTDLATAETTLHLVSLARSAATRGVLTDDEASRWEQDLRARDERGLFACYVLWFVASGRVSDTAG